MCSSDIFLGVLAILFPPLAVWVKRGICSADSLINILLCCLGFLPGLLHAWYIIAKFPDPEYESVPQEESGRVTYVYVAHGQGNGNGRQQPKTQKPMNPNYGTNAPIQAQASTQGENGTWQAGGEGSSNAAPPPTYSQAVGDHKVQTRD